MAHPIYNQNLGLIGILAQNTGTDPLAGTWVFNDTLDFSSLGLSQDDSISWSVNFTLLDAYAKEYNTITINYGVLDIDEEENAYIGYSLEYAYKATIGISEPPFVVYLSNSATGFLGWNASATATENKTITITSKLSEVTNGDSLLAWLQINATKQ